MKQAKVPTDIEMKRLLAVIVACDPGEVARNMAARLESANKHYGTNILVSDSTISQLKTALSWREIDLMRIWLFGSAFEWRAGQSWKEHAEISRAVLAGDEELAAVLANRHVLNVGGASVRGERPARRDDLQSASDANGSRRKKGTATDSRVAPLLEKKGFQERESDGSPPFSPTHTSGQQTD